MNETKQHRDVIHNRQLAIAIPIAIKAEDPMTATDRPTPTADSPRSEKQIAGLLCVAQGKR